MALAIKQSHQKQRSVVAACSEVQQLVMPARSKHTCVNSSYKAQRSAICAVAARVKVYMLAALVLALVMQISTGVPDGAASQRQ